MTERDYRGLRAYRVFDALRTPVQRVRAKRGSRLCRQRFNRAAALAKEARLRNLVERKAA